MGQGTIYFYDQQSSTDETPLPGAGGAIQQIVPPWGQSFTPALSSVGFIRLMLDDANLSDGRGATMYINLHSDSVTGAVVGTTSPLAMPNGFAGPATFLFVTEVPVSAGKMYFFEPVVQSGGTWNIVAGEYNYAGGSVFAAGLPATGSDLWFREGIVIPEPSTVAFLLAGLGLRAWIKGKRDQ